MRALRRAVKKEERRRQKKPQGKNIMTASATQGGHKKERRKMEITTASKYEWTIIKLRLLHAVDAIFDTIHHYVVGPEIRRPLVNIYASSVMIMALMIQIVFVHYGTLNVNA